MPPTVDIQQPTEKWLPELADDQLANLIAQTQKRIDDNTMRLALLRQVQTARQAVAAAAVPPQTPTTP
jgi:hypothetical protein